MFTVNVKFFFCMVNGTDAVGSYTECDGNRVSALIVILQPARFRIYLSFAVISLKASHSAPRISDSPFSLSLSRQFLMAQQQK